MNKFFVSSLLLFLFACCNKESDQNLIYEHASLIEKPFLWMNNDEDHDNIIITTPLIYDNSYISESHQNGISYMTMLNSKNGMIKWKWNGYEEKEDIDFRDCYSISNNLIWISGHRIYNINLESGKLNWIKTTPSTQFMINSGDQSTCLLQQNFATDSDLYPGLEILDIATGQTIQKIVPLFQNTRNKNVLDQLGGISGGSYYYHDNKKYILITYEEANDFYSSSPFIALYDVEAKSWLYNHLAVGNNFGPGLLKVIGDEMYFTIGNTIQCRNVLSGKLIWSKEFKGNFLFGRFIIENDILYAAAEGDGYYALYAKTGDVKWKGERAPGTSSKMVVLNGVLYYVNGGDGRLWAVDTETGKTLWRLKSPDNNFGFKREINVLAGDGKKKGYILTSTWHGACAYEAEK